MARDLPRTPDHDDALDCELLVSNHLAVVVRARLEHDGGAQETGLVIARRQCVGGLPRLSALLQAAAEVGARRPGRRLRRLWAQVQGRWVELPLPARPVAA